MFIGKLQGTTSTLTDALGHRFGQHLVCTNTGCGHKYELRGPETVCGTPVNKAGTPPSVLDTPLATIEATLRLRAQGLSFDKIAQQVGVPRRRVESILMHRVATKEEGDD